MPDEKHPLKVFLCHASADKPKVRELYRYLKRRGLQPWLDAEDLLPGQAWQVEIPKALETSDAIIICLSKGSVDKEGYVQKEIKFALDKALEMPEGRIFLIPARLEECNVPRSLSGYHWVDLFDESGRFKITKALKVRAEQLGRMEVHSPQANENDQVLTVKPKPQNLMQPVADATDDRSGRPSNKFKLKYLVVIICAVAAIALGIFIFPLIERWFPPFPVPTLTDMIIKTTPITLASPTPTPRNYVYDLVLPSGHTPPNSPDGAQPNILEVPEKDRESFIYQMEHLQAPLPSKIQAIRVKIPAINVDAPIVQGDGWEQLKKGVGQHVNGINPGELGNVVLSAHNDIFGEIFRDIDKLNLGDQIDVFTTENSYTYLVTMKQKDAEPLAIGFMSSSAPKYILTLITSYPYLIDSKRYVVQAELDTKNPTPNPIKVQIGIVSGHWGNDSGAVCENGTTEADVNLKIATLVQQKLFALGYNVDLLKEFDPRLTNYKGIVLVSIHNDSCNYINDQATGFKVAAAMDSRDTNLTNQLVACLRDRYQRATGLHLHDSSTNDMTFYHAFDEVDKTTPVAIMEAGFLNLDYKILADRPDLVAAGIADGILCYLNNEKVVP